MTRRQRAQAQGRHRGVTSWAPGGARGGLPDGLRWSLCSRRAVLLDGQLRVHGRAGVGFAAGVRGTARSGQRPRVHLHRGHRVNSAGAITSISEANDALGGTFATKSCQDLDCPDYTEVAVNIIAHCREYGNLNARSWPEKIAHENELTMAALAQTSEMFILERIKALSINVTSGAETLGALIYLVDAIVEGRVRDQGTLPDAA